LNLNAYLKPSAVLDIEGIDGISEKGGFLRFHPNFTFVASEKQKLQGIAKALFDNGDQLIWLENKGMGHKSPDMLLNGILTDMKGAGKIDYPSKNIKSTIDNGIKSAKIQTANGVLFVFDDSDYSKYDLSKQKTRIESLLLTKRKANPDFKIRCYLFGTPL
jgi:hypothetical protein